MFDTAQLAYNVRAWHVKVEAICLQRPDGRRVESFLTSKVPSRQLIARKLIACKAEGNSQNEHQIT